MALIHLENARLEEQRKVMEQIQADDVCPFCEEHLTQYHKKPILASGKFWQVTENQWPYEGAKVHLLGISRRHVESFEELTGEEAAELFTLFQEVAKVRNIKGATIAMRAGDSNGIHSSTVKHLHAHLIQPNLDDPEHGGLKFTVSKPATRQKGS